jgi:inorganic triphosphatase YgiF
MPTDPALLDRLAASERLGELQVKGRRREQQHNSFFDTASRGLRRGHVGFRRRVVAGKRLATWSLKGDGIEPAARGVATRSEVEVQLETDMAPALALGVLRQVAREKGALALAEQVGDALADGLLPRQTPYLETQTDRHILDLEAPEHGWQVELALDRVQLLGHRYSELEIEAELKRGDEAALDAARTAIEAVGEVRESEGSKLSRAIAHLEHCDCT